MTQTQHTDTFDQELTAGNVKAAMKAAGASSSDLWKVKREHIRVIPGFNLRNAEDPDYIAHIRWLANSITANGFYDDKPLAGYISREGDLNFINLTDGHSRLAAFDLAVSEGFEGNVLPVVVKPRGTSIEDLTIAMYTGNSGKPFTPYETGLLIKRLVALGVDEKLIAARLDITKRYLDDLLTLVEAPPSVRAFVAQGQVSATLAVDVVKAHGDKATERLRSGLETAKAAGKARLTKKHLKPVKSKPAPPPSTECGLDPESEDPAALVARLWAAMEEKAPVKSVMRSQAPELAAGLYALAMAAGKTI